MEQCDCYHIEYGHGRCWGTKDMEICYCNGEKAYCDFYKTVREKGSEKVETKMNTAEMWLKAQEDGQIYVSGDIAYSKFHGWVLIADFNEPWGLVAFTDYSGEPENAKHELDDLMNLEWVKYDKVIMTRADAEEKFNVKIVD